MEGLIIYFLGWVIAACIFGAITKYISESKGYYGGFAWGFWLGLIGILVVGFRPTITKSEIERPLYPEPKHGSQWECGYGAKNPNSLNYCLSCRRNRGDFKPVPKISCPHCGASNKETNTLCFACGKPLSSEKTEIAAAAKGTEEPVSMLEKLKKLHEQGILTDDEFQQKKAELLAKM